MKKIAVGTAVVIILAAAGGGGYYYTKYQMISQYIHKIEEKNPGLSIKYASNSINVFDKSATFNNVVVTDKHGNQYKAGTLSFSIAIDHMLPSLSIEHFQGNVGGYPINIAHFDAKNIKLVDKNEDHKIILNDQMKLPFTSFDDLNVKEIHVALSENNELNIASYHMDNFGWDRKTNQTIDGLQLIGNRAFGNHEVKQVQWNGLNLANLIPVIVQEYPELKNNDSWRDQLHAVGRIIEKVNFDLFRVDQYKAQGKGVNSSVAQYELKDWGLNRISSGSFQDMQFNISSGMAVGGISIHELSNKGGDIVKLLSVVLNGKLNSIDDVVQSIATYQKDLLKNKQLNSSSTMNGLTLNIMGITSSIAALKSDVTQVDDNYINQNATMSDLQIPVIPYGMFKTISKWGYSKIVVSFAGKSQYNIPQQQINLDFSMPVKDMGSLQTQIKYNAPFGFKEGESQKDRLEQLKVISATIDIQAADLIQKIIKSTAKQQNISEDQVKQQLSDFIVKEQKENNNFAKEVTVALQKVIQDPSEHIIITVNPSEPVPLSNISDSMNKHNKIVDEAVTPHVGGDAENKDALDNNANKDSQQQVVDLLNMHIVSKQVH